RVLYAEEVIDLPQTGRGEFAATPLFSLPTEGNPFTPQVPKVNLITGEYCEESCDLVVAGIEPLSFRRFYNHFTARSYQIYGHWHINPEAYMFFHFEHLNQTPFVAFGERNNTFFRYDHIAWLEFSHAFITQSDKIKGVTRNSGQCHPLNTKTRYWHHLDRSNRKSSPLSMWEGSIKDGSGRERIFQTDLLQWPTVTIPEPYCVIGYDDEYREEILSYLYF